MIIKEDSSSNKNFGIFFSFIFLSLSTYFFYFDNQLWSLLFLSLSIIFLLLAFLKNELLQPFNSVWIKFGLILSYIISPIILGGIYFLIFSPISFIMRLVGRDELRLKVNAGRTSWKKRNSNLESSSFNKQF